MRCNELIVRAALDISRQEYRTYGRPCFELLNEKSDTHDRGNGIMGALTAIMLLAYFKLSVCWQSTKTEHSHLLQLKKAEGKLSAANLLGGNQINEKLTLGYGKEEASGCQLWCGIPRI